MFFNLSSIPAPSLAIKILEVKISDVVDLITNLQFLFTAVF